LSPTACDTIEDGTSLTPVGLDSIDTRDAQQRIAGAVVAQQNGDALDLHHPAITNPVEAINVPAPGDEAILLTCEPPQRRGTPARARSQLSSDPRDPSRHLVAFPDGASIFEQGDAGDEMYIVQEGQVEIVLLREHGEVVSLATLERGDFFGEMAVLEGSKRTATARSKGGCRVLPLRGQLFTEMLQRDPETTLRIMRKLCARIRGLQARLGDLPDDELSFISEAVPVPPPAAVAPAAPLARLVHASGATLRVPDRAEIRVGRPDAAVGSVPDVDLTSLDDERTVSRSHARFLNRDRQLFVVAEQTATNGTFVNGERLAAEVPRPVRSGDQLTFGRVALRLDLG
jgi:CRP-like cAMP-binding protein